LLIFRPTKLYALFCCEGRVHLPGRGVHLRVSSVSPIKLRYCRT
jgi:hypothetical protein